MEMNARSRMAQTYLKLAAVDTLSTTYKSILVAKASEVLAGEPLLPLIADLMRRAYDPKEYATLTDAERSKVSIINSIVGMNDPGRLRVMRIIGDRVYRK